MKRQPSAGATNVALSASPAGPYTPPMTDSVSDRTTFLFANPSLVEGLARLVDLGGTFDQYNESATEEAADLRALTQDWSTVGDHLRLAFRAVAEANHPGK